MSHYKLIIILTIHVILNAPIIKNAIDDTSDRGRKPLQTIAKLS